MTHQHEHGENCNHHHEHAEPADSEESAQELMLKASLVEKHIEELNEKLGYLTQQLLEMEQFNKDVVFLKDSKGKDILAPVGKGIYLKSTIEEKNLFVNVGAGVVVKKSFEDTKAIIESQIKNFQEARMQLTANLEIYKNFLAQTFNTIEKTRESK